MATDLEFRKKVVLFGVGDFAKLMAHYINHESEYETAGFTIDSAYIEQQNLMDLPVVPFEEIEIHFPQSQYKILIAIGYTKTNKIRSQKYAEAKAKGYEFANFISRSALISDHATYGDNCIIMEGVIVQPFVKIGNGVVLWSGCHIGHHSVLSDYCFIAPRAALSGNVRVGERTFIGINSTIRDGIHISEDCVIGAGAIILEHTQEKAVYKATSANVLGIESDQLRNI